MVRNRKSISISKFFFAKKEMGDLKNLSQFPQIQTIRWRSSPGFSP